MKAFSTLLLAMMITSQSLFLGGCTPPQEAEEEEELLIPEANPFKENAAAIAEGKKIFEVKCGQCHGPDAAGGPEAPDLTDNESNYGNDDGDRFRIIWYGTPNNMPTWKKDLGKEKIWKVLAYVDSQSKSK